MDTDKILELLGEPIMNQKLPEFYHKLNELALKDVELLHERYKSYGDSWCKRGGIGAYMVTVRKADRLEQYLKNSDPPYDIFKAAKDDPRDEGILDDIADLRRYLFLIEAYIRTEIINGNEDKDEGLDYESAVLHQSLLVGGKGGDNKGS